MEKEKYTTDIWRECVFCFLGNRRKCFPNFKQIFLSETVLESEKSEMIAEGEKSIRSPTSPFQLTFTFRILEGMVWYGF